jgi:cyclopropane fatty-acyl-phospholipid synthase-like methyltransferase
MKNLENNGERMDINFYNMNYDSFDMYQKSHYKRYILATETINENDVVGDMACGSGYGSLMLSKKCSKVFGYDIDKTTIEEIKQRYANETSVEFNEKNLLDIDEKEKFDKIVSFETIEHFTPEEIKSLIPIMHNALKEDGYLIFSTPYDQVENQYSRIFHRTFYIKEDTINSFLEGYFTVEKFLYQDYVSHEVVENISKKDFIICIAKKINKNDI